jgi:hypothetical protein
MKVTRILVAGGTALALACAVAPTVAPEASASSAVLAGAGSSIITSVISLGVFLAFWGTVYNFLVNHGHIRGHIIQELPVF